MSVHLGGRGPGHIDRLPYGTRAAPAPGGTRVTTNGDIRATTGAQQRVLT